MRRTQIGALALAALTGASAWVSLGALAILNQREARLGTLPPLWALAALVTAALIIAWLARLRTAESLPLSLTSLLWLPWLPTTVPPALLIFDGPLEVIVWVAALAGVAAGRAQGAALWRAPFWSEPARAPWLAAALFFTCSVAAGAHLQPLLPGGDEPHYLVITQSLLYDGDLKIQNNHERGDFFEYVDEPIPPDFLHRGTDGQIYSVHAPGVSALVLPAFAVAGYPGALVFIALASAVGVATLWKIAFTLTANAGAAWAATLATAFSATVFLHSYTIFPDPPGAVLVAVALLVLVRLEMAPRSIGPRELLLAGVSLAGLPWLHTRFALVSAACGTVIALRLLSLPIATRSRAIAAFAAVPVLSAVAWLSFFLVIYGTPNPSAPYGGSRQAAIEWMAAGLAGLAFDQQFGLVANAPVIVLALWGLIVLAKERARLALEVVAIGAPYIAIVASFGMWWGGWSAPARLLTCLLPLATPLLAVAWDKNGRPLRSVFAALTIVGTTNVALRVAIEQGLLVYNFRDGFDLLLDWMVRSVNLPLAFPSIHRLGIEPTLLAASIWLVAGAVAVLVLHFVLQRWSLEAGAIWTIVTWTVVVSAGAALTTSWRALHTQPLTPQSSQIEFLQRWHPQRRPLAVRLPMFRVEPIDRALQSIQLRSSERARETKHGPAVLTLGRVPAGTYRVVIDGASQLDGQLSVSIGATSQTLEAWSLQGMQRGDTALQLHLPTRVHSVTIRPDLMAETAVSHVALRPEHLEANSRSHDRFARRAARYGRVRAFFLDDEVYMEPGGVWTRGDDVAEVVLVTDTAAPALVDVIAGPVQTNVDFATDMERQHVTLNPGERRTLQLSAGVWRIATEGRFRPKDYDPGSRDARSLGVRIEFK